jgi:mannose-6-phosphate isomerase-like protein (cupin superfamily)
LNQTNVLRALADVEQPFTLVDVAHVGALVMYAYFCHGAVQWHKHIDHDELFLVRDGWMTVESEWGNVTLRPDEMVIVPKGVAHRSGSQLRTKMVLLQPAAGADRRNGHRRILAIPGEKELRKFRLMDAARRANPFRPEPVADIEELTVQVVTGSGLAPVYTNPLSDSLWLVLQGEARMEAEGESAEMELNDLVVVGRGVPHRWDSPAAATMLLISQWREGAWPAD